MRRFTFETPEGDMAALEFGDPAKKLAALWLHATGFNAMTYLGDARVVLDRQRDLQFDLLVIDAFSSDSVPVHLMTD
ncbi:MAG: hypothetical protein AAGK93_03495, partial [Pseudomonadota bacterium]